jgi:hypothetical protein
MCNIVTRRKIMTRVIRIDDDVWAWLQKNARPLEDTANSVLRRVAGLDESHAPSTPEVNSAAETPKVSVHKASYRKQVRGSKYRTDTAQHLQELWGVSARHVLYHKDGGYYNHLRRFPGALFDPHGYVVFRTEEGYLSSPHLQHGQQLHVKGGISSMPGYVRKR